MDGGLEMGRKSRKANLKLEPVMEVPVLFKVPVENKKPTAAYARLSVEKDTDDSIQTQIAMLHDYINSREDLVLVDTYIDNGFTATNFERPAFMKMMEDVRAGKIQSIVVKDLSRFGRDHIETGYYIETILPKLDVNLISINDNFDSSKESDRNGMMMPIKNMINEMYAKDISKKRSMVFEAQKKRGEVKIARSIYGYSIDKENNVLIENPETAPIVKIIFRWYVMGYNPIEIARRLELMNIMTPRAYKAENELDINVPDNDQWLADKILTIIRNQTYVGQTVHGKRKVAKYRNFPETKMPRSEWTIHKDTHKALVCVEDFDLAQKRFEDYGNKYRDRKKHYKEQREAITDCFPKKIRCMECGCTMYFNRRTNYKNEGMAEGAKRSFYLCREVDGGAKSCRQKIDADYLKAMVMEQLAQFINVVCDRSKLLKDHLEEKDGRNELKSYKVRLKNLQYRLAEAESKSVRLYEDFAEGILEEAEYKSLKDHYIGEKKELRTSIMELEVEKRIVEKQVESYLQFTKHLGQYLIDRTFQQSLIDELVEYVEVSGDGKIEIHLSCEDTFQDMEEILKGEKI